MKITIFDQIEYYAIGLKISLERLPDYKVIHIGEHLDLFESVHETDIVFITYSLYKTGGLYEIFPKSYPNIFLILEEDQPVTMDFKHPLDFCIVGYINRTTTSSTLYSYLERVINLCFRNLIKVRCGLKEFLSKLTPRECEVMEEVAKGKTSREIAVSLKVKFKTILKHRDNIREKIRPLSIKEFHRYLKVYGLYPFESDIEFLFKPNKPLRSTKEETQNTNDSEEISNIGLNFLNH